MDLTDMFHGSPRRYKLLKASNKQKYETTTARTARKKIEEKEAKEKAAAKQAAQAKEKAELEARIRVLNEGAVVVDNSGKNARRKKPSTAAEKKKLTPEERDQQAAEKGEEEGVMVDETGGDEVRLRSYYISFLYLAAGLLIYIILQRVWKESERLLIWEYLCDPAEGRWDRYKAKQSHYYRTVCCILAHSHMLPKY